jgi:hypothetical protein
MANNKWVFREKIFTIKCAPKWETLGIPVIASVYFKNTWNFTSTAPYIFIAWCLIKLRDKYFTSTAAIRSPPIILSRPHFGEIERIVKIREDFLFVDNPFGLERKRIQHIYSGRKKQIN